MYVVVAVATPRPHPPSALFMSVRVGRRVEEEAELDIELVSTFRKLSRQNRLSRWSECLGTRIFLLHIPSSFTPQLPNISCYEDLLENVTVPEKNVKLIPAF